MLPETLQYLEAHKFVGGETVNRAALADSCLAVLTEDLVTTAAEADDKALILAELRHRLLGEAPSEDVEREVEAILSSLVALKADGPVQERLADGLVLCSKSVERRLGNGSDGTVTIKRKGRFVTGDPELIERFYLAPEQDAWLRKAQGLNKRFALALERQPALASRRRPMLVEARDQLRLELPEVTA